jgi:hypothetical protein
MGTMPYVLEGMYVKIKLNILTEADGKGPTVPSESSLLLFACNPGFFKFFLKGAL